MISNQLFFKKKQINGAAIELTFQRGFGEGYRSGDYPVVTYVLSDCKDISALDWDLLDPYNDGVIIASIGAGDRYVFQAMDMGGRKFEIDCGRITEEFRAYDAEELNDLLIEAGRQMVSSEASARRLQDKLDGIRVFLEREFEVNARKLDQADWLTESKREFLQGQNSIIQAVLEQMGTK